MNNYIRLSALKHLSSTADQAQNLQTIQVNKAEQGMLRSAVLVKQLQNCTVVCNRSQPVIFPNMQQYEEKLLLQFS